MQSHKLPANIISAIGLEVDQKNWKMGVIFEAVLFTENSIQTLSFQLKSKVIELTTILFDWYCI